MSGTGEVAVLRAVAPAASAGGRRLWRRWRPDLSPPALDAVQQVLAEKVLQQEQQRLAELGVIRRGEIAVPLDDGRSVRDIVTIYDDVESGRLLLTGEPGSGKTVAVLELVLGLLERRFQDVGQSRRAVPVRLNAAGWDGELDATVFFGQRISEAYPAVRAAQAQALLSSRRVVVVLDGLDEMDPPDQPPRRAALALQLLSEDPVRDWPLVLTCRTDSYQQILQDEELGGRELLYASRIRIESLTPAVIGSFLRNQLAGEDHTARRYRLAAEQVLIELDNCPDGPLTQALGSPWLLSLTLDHLRRGGAVAAEQLRNQPDLDAVQDALFAALVPTAVASQRRERGRRRYAEPDVQRWLGRFADYLTTNADGGTEIGLHELWPMAGPTRRTRLIAGIATGLMCAILSLLGGLALSLSAGLTKGLLLGLGIGLTFGVAFGLANGLPSTGAPLQIVLGTHRKGMLRRRIKTALAIGPMTGLLVGLLLGPPVWLKDGPREGLAFGLIGGSMTSVVAAALALILFVVPAGAIPAQRARTVIRKDSHAVATTGTVVGLAAALAVGLPIGLTIGPRTGMIGALGFALMGLPVGLSSAQVTTRYLTAAALFHHSGRFAGRPAPFLDWANRAGLLRTTGIRYQFRHETYRDWLVQQAQPRTIPDT